MEPSTQGRLLEPGNDSGTPAFARKNDKPRVAVTTDGYKFTEQPDGSWSDGDMNYGSIDDLFEQEPQLVIDGKIYSEKAWRTEEAKKGGFNPLDTNFEDGGNNDDEFDPMDGDIKFSRTTDQTNTPAFKKWFADSKVIDAQGKPLVVYHGINKSESGEALPNSILMAATMGCLGWVDQLALERGKETLSPNRGNPYSSQLQLLPAKHICQFITHRPFALLSVRFNLQLRRNTCQFRRGM